MSRTTDRWRRRGAKGTRGTPERLPERRYPITQPALPSTLRLKNIIIEDELVVDGDITIGDDDPSNAPSDGIPPVASPTPTVRGGQRWLAVEWIAQTNIDMVTYNVHVSSTPGFSPSATTLAASTPGTLQFIRSVNGTPLAYDTDYYVKIVAQDIDGSAPEGGQVGPTKLDRNATDDITVGSITADRLAAVIALASSLVGGTLGAQRVEVGYGTDSVGALDPSFIGVRSFSADGTTTTFRVDAITGEVYVKGRLDFGAGSRLLAEDIIEVGPQSTTVSGFMTPQLIQSTHKVSALGGSSSLTLTWPSPTTTGNVCLLSIAMYDEDGTAPAAPSPTGWTLEVSSTGGGGEFKTFLYRSTTGASRSGSETITLGDTMNACIQMSEWSGVQVATADKTATANGVSTAMVTGTTATTTQADELWFGVMSTYGSVISDPETFTTVDNGFTIMRQTVDPYDPILFGETQLFISTSAYKIVTAVGTASTGHTLSQSFTWQGAIMALKSKPIVATVETPDAGKVRLYNKKDRFEDPMLATMDDIGSERAMRPFQDVEKRFSHINDFTGASFNVSAGANGNIDGMFQAASNGAASSVTSVDPEAQHPGVSQLDTGTATTGSAYINTRGTSIPMATGDIVRITGILKTPGTASNGTNRYDLAVGFWVGADPRTVTVPGAWVMYTDSGPAIGGGGTKNDGNWTLYHGDGTDLAADPLNDGTNTFAVTTWYRIDIEHVVGTGTSVWINGSKAVTNFSTNLFAGGTLNQIQCGIRKQLGTTARTTNVDLLAFEYIMATAR